MTTAPSPRQEQALLSLFERAFMRGLRHAPQDPPPPEWRAQPVGVVRPSGGVVAALHVPHEAPRGLVVFGHPGIAPAKGWFHRNDRIPFVRELGFAAMTFDHGGFGESDDATALFHREWIAVLRAARKRYPDLPLHVWGVSMGGYFAHHALAAEKLDVTSAIFEQVSPDLLQYGDSAGLKAAGALFGMLSPALRRWQAAETQAPLVAVEHSLYLTSDADAGVPPAQAARLAAAAGPFARHHVVRGAGHLEAWKLGGKAARDAVERLLLS